MPTMTWLERLDLALARRLCPRLHEFQGEGVDPEWQPPSPVAPGVMRPSAAVVAGLMELRGLELPLADVHAVLLGRQGRYREGQQEHTLIAGAAACVHAVSRRAQDGLLPDGDFAVHLFRTLVGDMARFRNNWLRRDVPWDGLLHVSYPEAGEIPDLLADFRPGNSYRDVPLRFEAVHPVRQSFRVLWRLARIAPFADFNVPIAFLVMNGYLLAKGYPPVMPRAGDRVLLHRTLQGPPPVKMLPFEARLAEYFDL